MKSKVYFAGQYSPKYNALSTPFRTPHAKFRTRDPSSSPLQPQQFPAAAASRRGRQPVAGGRGAPDFESRDAADDFAMTITHKSAKKTRGRVPGSQSQRQLFAAAAGTDELQPASGRADDASFAKKAVSACRSTPPEATRAAVHEPSATVTPSGQPLLAASLRPQQLNSVTCAASDVKMRSGTGRAHDCGEIVATGAASQPSDHAGAPGASAPPAAVSNGCLSKCAAGSVTGSVFRARRGSQPGFSGSMDARTFLRDASVAWWTPEPSPVRSGAAGNALGANGCQLGGLCASPQPETAADYAVVAAASIDAANAVEAASVASRPAARPREVRRRRWMAAMRLQAAWRQALQRRLHQRLEAAHERWAARGPYWGEEESAQRFRQAAHATGITIVEIGGEG